MYQCNTVEEHLSDSIMYLIECLSQVSSDVSRYNLGDNGYYALPRCGLRISETSLLPSTVRIWNNLNPTVIYERFHNLH